MSLFDNHSLKIVDSIRNWHIFQFLGKWKDKVRSYVTYTIPSFIIDRSALQESTNAWQRGEEDPYKLGKKSICKQVFLK